MDCPKRSASAGLPEDSLVEILARVPARSVYRSKCVAKAWRDLIEDPLHHKKLPQTLQGFFLIDKETHRRRVGFTNLLARPVPPQIDPSLSFLKKLLGIGTLSFSATRYNYLVFDPSVSSHFHLIQFTWEFMRLVKFEEEEFVVVHGDDDDDADADADADAAAAADDDDYWGRRHQQRYNYDEDEDGDEEEELSRTSVHVYSSETGKWTHTQSDWSQIQSERNKHDLEGWRLQGLIPESFCCAVLNSMLHFIISDEGQIAAVDVQGVTRKIIPVPTMAERLHWLEPGYVAQSQGRLHYISQAVDGQLSIWVLEGYDTQEWVLKHSVSFMELFRKKRRTGDKIDYSVVAMHPDGNVVFIVQDWNQKMISYHMDHKLVSTMGTLKNDASDMHVVPYVPCFSESPALPTKH